MKKYLLIIGVLSMVFTDIIKAQSHKVIISVANANMQRHNMTADKADKWSVGSYNYSNGTYLWEKLTKLDTSLDRRNQPLATTGYYGNAALTRLITYRK